MKNKIKIGLFVLIVIGVVTLCLAYKSKNEVIIKTKKKKQNNIAIMIKPDYEQYYIKSTSKEIPKGQYYNLDYDKSYCKNNSKIGDYDNELGKVSFSFVGTDSCYLYFYEFIKPDFGNAQISIDVSDAKIMTLDITWNGYGSWEMPNIEKFIITGFRDFKLEQASGPFEIDLNTLNLDVGVNYTISICGVYTTGDQSCASREFEYE